LFSSTKANVGNAEGDMLASTSHPDPAEYASKATSYEVLKKLQNHTFSKLDRRHDFGALAAATDHKWLQHTVFQQSQQQSETGQTYDEPVSDAELSISLQDYKQTLSFERNFKTGLSRNLKHVDPGDCSSAAEMLNLDQLSGTNRANERNHQTRESHLRNEYQIAGGFVRRLRCWRL
jgi:hypothetical protein